MTVLFVAPGFDTRDELLALLNSPGMASLSPIAYDNLQARIALLDAGIPMSGTVYAVDTEAATYETVNFAGAYPAANAAAVDPVVPTTVGASPNNSLWIWLGLGAAFLLSRRK